MARLYLLFSCPVHLPQKAVSNVFFVSGAQFSCVFFTMSTTSPVECVADFSFMKLNGLCENLPPLPGMLNNKSVYIRMRALSIYFWAITSLLLLSFFPQTAVARLYCFRCKLWSWGFFYFHLRHSFGKFFTRKMYHVSISPRSDCGHCSFVLNSSLTICVTNSYWKTKLSKYHHASNIITIIYFERNAEMISIRKKNEDSNTNKI